MDGTLNRIARDESDGSFLQKYRWLFAAFGVIATSTFLRFFRLDIKPFHHDEGVNGHFLIRLFREGIYTYDPSNYHGPTLYYNALAFAKIFGLENVSVRASVAVFGVLMVILILFFKKFLGNAGTLFAALFVGLSPGMVFISRYFIHEISFVFFSLGVVAGVLFFVEGKRPGIFAIAAFALIMLVSFSPPVFLLPNLILAETSNYVWTVRGALFLLEAGIIFFLTRIILDTNNGRSLYLLLSAACVALMFATKETAFITIGTMIIAIFCVYLWSRIYPADDMQDDLSPVQLSFATLRKRFEDREEFIYTMITGTAVFVLVSIVFFSSFFTYWQGVEKAFEAYAIWTRTGTADHTQSGILAYAKWLLRIESPILFLSTLGSLIALFKARHRFAVFTAFWAYGLFAAYSLIPYKTPWLLLSFLLPMCLIAGYGLQELVSSNNKLLKITGALLGIVAVAVLAYQMFDLNFRRYDDESLPYVYAHTRRGFKDLIDKIDYYSAKSLKGNDAMVQVVSPEYWPMPWYTRNSPNVIFQGKIVPTNSAEMVIAQKGVEETELIAEYSTHYKYAGEFPLRPGVDLILLVRRDLADFQTKEIYRALSVIE